MEHRKVIAIDFDGTLCENAWPEIGTPRWEVIERAKNAQSNGAALILWTCRDGERLEQAVEACTQWGLQFDAVNENLPERKALYGNDPRKIGADEYWDDKAVPLPESAERVLILPCEIGDKVYKVNRGDYRSNYKPYVAEGTVTEISIKTRNKKISRAIIVNWAYGLNTWYELTSIGKTVFLTRDEAYAKLGGK